MRVLAIGKVINGKAVITKVLKKGAIKCLKRRK